MFVENEKPEVLEAPKPPQEKPADPTEILEHAHKTMGKTVITQGMVLWIGGGKFRIASVGKRCIVLEAMPGTKLHVRKKR